jgi:uncharacterized membrane protein
MPTTSTTLRNIKTIGDLEKSTLERRTLSARLGDLITTQAGKTWFVLFHVVWFGTWLWFNLHKATTFDPFPFTFLTMMVSLESIFLSLFILMSQNSSKIAADQRNHLDLQINLLSEDENTKMLQMLKALCDYHKLGIGNDPEITSMAQRTEVNEVISELKEHLPGED